MEATALNRVNLLAVPAPVKTELCMDAIEAAQRHRSDPDYQERYQKWLSERKRKSA